MTVTECVEVFKTANVGAVCFINPEEGLKTTESLFVILSCIALVVAAWIAWFQLKAIGTQIRDARQLAVDQIAAARDNERLSATLGLLIQIQTNSHWLENRQTFAALRDSKEGLKKHAHENSKDAFSIRAMLNQYELIAVGISRGILDETMYRTYYRGTVIKDWMAAAQFIDEERKENDRYWIELQKLAEKFQTQS